MVVCYKILVSGRDILNAKEYLICPLHLAIFPLILVRSLMLVMAVAPRGGHYHLIYNYRSGDFYPYHLSSLSSVQPCGGVGLSYL